MNVEILQCIEEARLRMIDLSHASSLESFLHISQKLLSFVDQQNQRNGMLDNSTDIQAIVPTWLVNQMVKINGAHY